MTVPARVTGDVAPATRYGPQAVAITAFIFMATPHDGASPPRASPLDLARGPSPDATRIDWASLIRHGLDLDCLACTRCGSCMRVLSAVTDPAQVRRVLDHLGERTRQRVPSRAWDPVPVDDGELPIGDWN